MVGFCCFFGGFGWFMVVFWWLLVWVVHGGLFLFLLMAFVCFYFSFLAGFGCSFVSFGCFWKLRKTPKPSENKKKQERMVCHGFTVIVLEGNK